jgi:hypothetical protein
VLNGLKRLPRTAATVAGSFIAQFELDMPLATSPAILAAASSAAFEPCAHPV